MGNNEKMKKILSEAPDYSKTAAWYRIPEIIKEGDTHGTYSRQVFRNAKIYSVALDGREIRGEALAIKDGKFAYVGDEAGVAEWIGYNT